MSHTPIPDDMTFGEWFKSLPTTPLLSESDTLRLLRRNIPLEREIRKEKYKHDYLMANSDWYRRSVEHAKRVEKEIEAEQAQLPLPKQYGEKGFWDQFGK